MNLVKTQYQGNISSQVSKKNVEKSSSSLILNIIDHEHMAACTCTTCCMYMYNMLHVNYHNIRSSPSGSNSLHLLSAL